ncbi:MAG: RNase adapter RapZ, partial [Nitrospirales bacterium]
IKHVALGLDIRERAFFPDLFASLDRVKSFGYPVDFLFFEARDEVLQRRFSESRRPHPLLPQAPVLEGIRRERERLAELRRRADRILDTSDLTVHELKDLLARQYLSEGQDRRLSLSVVTFGFKYGVPYDADLVFDLRFLRNPNFVPELKALTGEDPRVQAYVLDHQETQTFLQHLDALFRFLIPLFERERRSYLTIALGCTGGRHRSVAVASNLKDRLASLGQDVVIRHRDLGKV